MEAGKSDAASASEGRTVRVLVVASPPICRIGIAAMLRAPGLEVLGEAEPSEEALRLVEASAPDLVVLAAWPHENAALVVLRRLKERHPTVSVVIVSAGSASTDSRLALGAGCSGYIGPTVSPEELRRTVCQVAGGERVFEPSALREVLQDMARRPGMRLAALTLPELAVLRLITEGRTNRQIAEQCDYSLGTVKDYVQRIIQKMEVSDRTQAAVKAVRLGMFD